MAHGLESRAAARRGLESNAAALQGLESWAVAGPGPTAQNSRPHGGLRWPEAKAVKAPPKDLSRKRGLKGRNQRPSGLTHVRASNSPAQSPAAVHGSRLQALRASSGPRPPRMQDCCLPIPHPPNIPRMIPAASCQLSLPEQGTWLGNVVFQNSDGWGRPGMRASLHCTYPGFHKRMPSREFGSRTDARTVSWKLSAKSLHCLPRTCGRRGSMQTPKVIPGSTNACRQRSSEVGRMHGRSVGSSPLNHCTSYREPAAAKSACTRQR